MTQEYDIEKYGLELGPIKYQEFKEKTKFMTSEAQYIKKYGEELGKQKWTEYCKSCARTKESFIKKHGEQEGLIRWNRYCKRQRRSEHICL